MYFIRSEHTLKLILKAFIVFILYGANICSAATIVHTYKSVYIDPFYGGENSGPIIAKTHKAKDITLQIGKELQKKLEARGTNVNLSRNKDVLLASDMRIVSAKSLGADVYIGVRVSYQDNDCIRLYHLKSHLIKSKTSGDRNSLEDIYKALEIDDLAFESDRLATIISTKLEKVKAVACVSTSTQYNDDEVFDVIASSPCPVVIVDFSVAKSADINSYILNSDKINKAINAISEAVMEFMKRSAVEVN